MADVFSFVTAYADIAHKLICPNARNGSGLRVMLSKERCEDPMIVTINAVVSDDGVASAATGDADKGTR